MKVCVLEEEKFEVDEMFTVKDYEYVKLEELENLVCDILFVKDKKIISSFIKDIETYENSIFETEDISYIVIEDIKLFKLIKENFNEILITKYDEDYLTKNVYKFFRIKEKKLFTVIKNFSNFFFIPDENGRFTAIDNVKCSKCFDYFYKGDKTYEKDINKFKRFALLSAKKGKIKFGTNYRVIYFDIETLASVDCVNTPEPVISLAAYDNLTKEMKYWQIDNSGTFEEPIYDVVKEKEMLEEFFKFMSLADAVAGFNSVKFDWPYIINRGIKVGADVNLLSTVGAPISCKFKGANDPYPWFVKIIGTNIVDLMQSSVRAVAYMDVKLPDSKLDTLGKYLLGESKVEVDTPAILWKNKNYEKLKEYNIQDVNLTYKLDEKLGVMDLLISTLEFVPGLNLEDSNYNSKIIDFYLLSKFNIVMPTVDKSNVTDVKGAVVFEPVQGIHDNVAALDISGMYPNLVRTFNISPDTLDKDGDIDINGIRFTSEYEGILVKLITDFTVLRKKYKALKKEHEDDADYKLYQLREFATKKILSSVYGVFGYRGFRLFSNDIANAITSSGRELLGWMKDFAEKNGCRVVLGDTDSIFIINNDIDYEKFTEEMNSHLKEFVNKFTNAKNIIDNHKLVIEYETLFKRVIIPPAKKKYIGITIREKGKNLKKPNLYGKGNELVKKDVPSGLKDEIRKMVLDILNNEDSTKDNVDIIKERVRKIKTEIYNYKVDDLIIHREINREFDSYKQLPQHVRASINSNNHLGTNFSRQDYKGGILFVKSIKYPEIDVLFLNDKVELTKDFEIDYNKYYEKFIIEKIRLIFGDDIYERVTGRYKKRDKDESDNDNLGKWFK